MKNLIFILCFLSTFVQAQRTISGTITDAKGEPLIGASVLCKGTTNGTVSDIDGKYSFMIRLKDTILVVSFVGYQSKEVAIGMSNIMDASLDEAIPMKEVVVTALSIHRESKSIAYSSMSMSKGMAITASPTRSRIHKNSNLHHSDTLQNTENYKLIVENNFESVLNNPLSTFSIDVDKASYSNVRRHITEKQLPPVDAVRLEELINYFDYDYPKPTGKHPLTMTTEIGTCFWNPKNYLLHIGIKGKEYSLEQAPKSNLVFLIDVSGSMNQEKKLPLVIESFKLLVTHLRATDRIAIVVYAGSAGEVLPSTSGADKATILAALERLSAGGSTAGGAGIELAYKIAQQNFIPDGNNRVLLATDGDFNVGVSTESELTHLIEQKRKSNIYLSVLGFGMGNLQDASLEALADKGNGNYAYIDDISEANRVFGSELTGTLFTIAKDVKLQIEFNPRLVKRYRLVGYENRTLQNEDFKDDLKDAGELGAGQTVTALYEIEPMTEVLPTQTLRYQKSKLSPKAATNEWATIQFRYKLPHQPKSLLLNHVAAGSPKVWQEASDPFKWSSTVASYGLLLRKSAYKGQLTYEAILETAQTLKGVAEKGIRADFLELVRNTAILDR
jgi:Ca-activated chloride channel family protein